MHATAEIAHQHFPARRPSTTLPVLWTLHFDSEFIHNWIAAEGLAKVICSAPEFGETSGDPPLVKDWSAWKRWVREHKRDLQELANPADGGRLYSRVVNMAQRDGGKVERAFRILSLPWKPQMTDVQDVRNPAIHEGVLCEPASREWQQDTKRVGLIKTMLTALLAKIVGYTGPIADREITEFSISGQEVPSWWTVEDKPARVFYRGHGTPTVEETREMLRNLQETLSTP